MWSMQHSIPSTFPIWELLAEELNVHHLPNWEGDP